MFWATIFNSCILSIFRRKSNKTNSFWVSIWSFQQINTVYISTFIEEFFDIIFSGIKWKSPYKDFMILLSLLSLLSWLLRLLLLFWWLRSIIIFIFILLFNLLSLLWSFSLLNCFFGGRGNIIWIFIWILFLDLWFNWGLSSWFCSNNSWFSRHYSFLWWRRNIIWILIWILFLNLWFNWGLCLDHRFSNWFCGNYCLFWRRGDIIWFFIRIILLNLLFNWDFCLDSWLWNSWLSSNNRFFWGRDIIRFFIRILFNWDFCLNSWFSSLFNWGCHFFRGSRDIIWFLIRILLFNRLFLNDCSLLWRRWNIIRIIIFLYRLLLCLLRDILICGVWLCSIKTAFFDCLYQLNWFILLIWIYLWCFSNYFSCSNNCLLLLFFWGRRNITQFIRIRVLFFYWCTLVSFNKFVGCLNGFCDFRHFF